MPPKSRHCNICHVCISRYDHHCAWINNCVGGKNYTIYLIFILVSFIYLSMNIVSGIYIFVNPDMMTPPDSNGLAFKIFPNYFYKKNAAFAIICVIFTASLLIYYPLCFLMSTHVRNLWNGKTTFERHLIKVFQETSK